MAQLRFAKGRFTAYVVAALLFALLVVSVSVAMGEHTDMEGRPKASKGSAASGSSSKSSSSSTRSSAPKSKSAIIADRQSRVKKLRDLGSVDKIRDSLAQFEHTQAKAKEVLQNILTLEAGTGSESLQVQSGKQAAAIRYVQRARAKVALLNAKYTSVKNPSPFSVMSSVALRSDAQYKKMISSRRRKGLKIPVKRFGDKPTFTSQKKNMANSKVAKLKDKVSAAAAKDATNSASSAKSRSVSLTKSKGKKPKSLLQLSSAADATDPRYGAGGSAGKSGKSGGGAGTDASKSGKTGGGSGTDASKSGKTGGGSGGDSGKSGKTGGIPGGDASKSGKTGGNAGGVVGPGSSTSDDSAKCNPPAPAGVVTYWSAKSQGIKIYKNTPGYKASPGDMVMADGGIFNQGAPPPARQYNPRTGKCFDPVVTRGMGGVVYQGKCPTCAMGANPAINPGSRTPWGDWQIFYDENDQICYGPNCKSTDENGALVYPFNPWIANGVVRSGGDSPTMMFGSEFVTILQRNQGDGSWCWANTAVMITEMAQQLLHKDATGAVIPRTFAGPLSVAQIVKCVPNQGKDGGSPIDALEWLKTHNLGSQTVSRDAPCPPAVPLGKGTVDSYVTPIPTCDHGDCSGQSKYEEELAKQVILMPTLVYVDAANWKSYKPQPLVGFAQGRIADKSYMESITFPTSACSNNPDLGNHVVVVVGTIKDPTSNKKFWKILNSWGPNWGVGAVQNGPKSDPLGNTGGYIYLEFGVNACGLANYPISVEGA